MRIGNLSGRLAIFTEAGAVDVEKASKGAFSSDPQYVYERWAGLRAWAAEGGPRRGESLRPRRPRLPDPGAGQIFAVGLNYHSHAAEAGIADPGTTPLIFTKFASSLTGPVATVEVPRAMSTGKPSWSW